MYTFEKKFKRMKKQFLLICFLSMNSWLFGQTDRVYVNPNSSGNLLDGSTWEKGVHTLQEGINKALLSSETNVEIWVKSGVYSPTDSAGQPAVNPRNNRIIIPFHTKNLSIYGSLNGTETVINRNKITPTTIVSGENNTPNTNSDNLANLLIILNSAGTLTLYDMEFTRANSVGTSEQTSALTVVNSGMLQIINCTFSHNLSGTRGGALRAMGTVTRIIQSRFEHNNAVEQGGALYINGPSLITSSTFRQNSTDINGYGGAIKYETATSNNFITNCIFENNFSLAGAAIQVFNSEISIINCNFLKHNKPVFSMYDANKFCYVVNSIFWQNDMRQSPGSQGNVVVSYSILDSVGAGITGSQSNNNNLIAQNPSFINDSSYLLTKCSPAINAGNNGNIISGIMLEVDFNGGQRIVDEKVDIGAYEYRKFHSLISDSISPTLVTLKLNNVSSHDIDSGFIWYDCSDHSLVTRTSEPIFSPTKSGLYKVIFYQNKCTDTSACVMVNLTPSTFTNKYELAEITFFPLPASDHITVSGLSKNGFYSLTDLTGKTLLKNHFTYTDFSIDVKSIPNGIYLLTVNQTDGALIHKKIIISK